MSENPDWAWSLALELMPKDELGLIIGSPQPAYAIADALRTAKANGMRNGAVIIENLVHGATDLANYQTSLALILRQTAEKIERGETNA